MLNNTGLFENGCKNPDLIVAFSTKIQASGENSGGRGGGGGCIVERSVAGAGSAVESVSIFIKLF